jgi:4-hydroxybenzoate polyprenyltransferase
VFARELFDPSRVLVACRAFFVFSLAASIVYIINDIMDAPADRAHPEKRHRPIASGIVPVPQALLMLGVLGAGGTLLLMGMPLKFAFAVSGYVAINFLYSVRLKDIVLLDVFIVAAGFMLRVLGGAYAISVQVSSWLVLCSLFISLFLGFAKRRAELLLLRKAGLKAERRVLAMYEVAFLDQMLTIAAAGAVISYALYTVAPRTVEMFGTDKLIYTTVFVCYGVFRYLFLIHTTSETENPTNAVTSDLPILVTGILWILSCAAIIYSGGHLPL